MGIFFGKLSYAKRTTDLQSFHTRLCPKTALKLASITRSFGALTQFTHQNAWPVFLHLDFDFTTLVVHTAESLIPWYYPRTN